MNNYQFNRNLSSCAVFLAKGWFMLHKISIKTYQRVFYMQKNDSCCVKENVYVLILDARR